jgi:hypothetical protein
MGKNKEITKRINANGSPKQSSKNNGENQKQPSLDHQALGYNRSHVEALEKRLRIVEQQLRDKEALEAKVEENSQKYEKLNVELEQLKVESSFLLSKSLDLNKFQLKFERGSANGDNVVVSRSLLEALGIPREEAYPVHLLRDRFFELKLENRELKERFLQVTNKCDQPAEEEGGVLEIKTERLSHSPAEKFANLAGRISELEKELAEARANKQQNPNDTKQEVEEEEEKKNLQIEVQKRDFEVMKSELDATKSTMFVLQGQLATLLSMVYSAHL